MRSRERRALVGAIGVAVSLVTLSLARAEDQPPESVVIGKLREVGALVRPFVQSSQAYEVEFHIRGRDLRDDGLAHVAALGGVVSLNLRGTKITGAGLVHLRGLRSLRRLHLERTAVGDKGFEHIAELVNLEYLNVYGTKITDRSLEQLRGLKKLRRLYVWQTGVTNKGVAALEKALPDLQIIGGVDLSKIRELDLKEPPPPKIKGDLKWIATTEASDAPKSQNGVNTTVFFQNKSGKAVKLYWVSYGGPLQLYAELKPGDERQQNSYASNTWLITDASENPLGYFIVGSEVSRAVIPKVPDKK